MVWGILECLGNQERLDLPTGGGIERKGCTQTLNEGDKRGAWWGGRGWGVSWGPRQLAGLGSRGEGPGQMVIILFLGLGEKGEEDHAGSPRKRGYVWSWSGPWCPESHLPSLHLSLTPIPDAEPEPMGALPIPTSPYYLSLSGVGKFLCCYTPHNHPQEGTSPPHC